MKKGSDSEQMSAFWWCVKCGQHARPSVPRLLPSPLAMLGPTLASPKELGTRRKYVNYVGT